MLQGLVGLAVVRLVVESSFAVQPQQVPRLRDIALFGWAGAVEACV